MIGVDAQDCKDRRPGILDVGRPLWLQLLVSVSGASDDISAVVSGVLGLRSYYPRRSLDSGDGLSVWFSWFLRRRLGLLLGYL